LIDLYKAAVAGDSARTLEANIAAETENCVAVSEARYQFAVERSWPPLLSEAAAFGKRPIE